MGESMKKTILNLFTICFITIILCCGCTSTTQNNQISDKKSLPKESACSADLLHQFANTEEDLLITHEITGIIVGRAEYAGKYVVKVDKTLWNQTTAEQRILIRCSTETVAKQKGLIGVVLDPAKNEQLN